MPRGCPRPKAARKPVFCDLPPLGVWSAKTQNVKKLRNVWEKLMGRTDVFPKSVPSSGKLHFPVSGSEVPRGCPRPKGPRKPVFRDSPAMGVRSAKTHVKKLRNFGDKLLGRTDFSPKSAPGSGKLCFSIFGPEFLQVPRAALGQKGVENQCFAISRPWGGRSTKTQNVKLRNFGEKPLGRTDFFPKGTPGSGKLCFSAFGPGPEFL